VPEEHAIRGFFGVTLALSRAEATAALLEEMGFEETERDGDRTRYRADGDLGYAVDVLADPGMPEGRPGAGTVHHVAFQVTRETQEAWRQALIDRGLRPTEIIDRKWFESVYVRLPSGVLFEFATKEPGYTVDEDLDALGESLVLPEEMEQHREQIEAGLPEL
jgi:glyoxalase family protein